MEAELSAGWTLRTKSSESTNGWAEAESTLSGMVVGEEEEEEEEEEEDEEVVVAAGAVFV